MSNLVDSWLNGIGLGYAVPVFAGQGINSPEKLSELDVVDFPELGISDQNDRKKLFYLIQRVKLALARGGTAGTKTKAAPQADSAVSSTSADVRGKGRHRQRETAGAKRSQAATENASHNPVRFRRELEIPGSASRSASAPSSPRATADAARIAPASRGAVGGRLTPARVQRLPPSHRRPKTPHADGSVGERHQGHQQRQQLSAGVRRSSPGATRRRDQQHQQEPPGGRVSVAAESSFALSADEYETSTSSPEEVHGVSRGCGNRQQAPLAAASRTRSIRSKKSSGEHRSVLEPVQLDEAGGRNRMSSSSSNTDTDTDSAPADHRLMPPPPPPSSAHHQGVIPGDYAMRTITRSASLSRLDAAVDVTTAPPQPPLNDALDRSRDCFGSRASSRQQSPEGRQVAPPLHTAPPAAPSTTAACLYPSERHDTVVAATAPAVATGYSSKSSARMIAHTVEAPTRSSGSSGEQRPPIAGRDEEQADAPMLLTPRTRRREGIEEYDEGDVEQQEATAMAEVGRKENGRRESASELAMHLISAHREDVRSALAAARRDMDLVSKVDQDRQPAALMAYTIEVEGVLAQRMAASAKLRQALDSYWDLRQAAAAATAAAAAAAASLSRPEAHELQRRRRAAGGRVVQTWHSSGGERAV